MRYVVSVATLGILAASLYGQNEIPKVADPRLVVELVAQQPDIVHPISCDFDHKGRLLVIESHTHFAPKDYKGPKFDRILAVDPRLAPGAGKRITTFFEGTRHTMDLAVHPDGSVYIATRNEILRLRETPSPLTPLPEGEGKGVRVKSERIVFLDTKGDYPHNGLSGLCFDSKGDLTFGMGENLGVVYKLIGSDGVTISGEEGGHIFHCSADGKKLRKVATGFWNPFGICRDIYGRVFAVDNDPDQSPPCRMVHVVEGGDYGFRFMYGRSGKHPFQSWHGELPGTLPMMTGVGEAPCEILSYESDGLPKEYLGKLMVTSWADHRVELYKVLPHGASFKAERQPFVQGGNNFRPTGMCVAPDGSLYVCDWVLPNYTLHGKGAIWRIREKQSRERKRPADPKEAIFSMHRPLREVAAKKLARDAKGRDFLLAKLPTFNAAERAAALTALIDAGDKKIDVAAIAGKDIDIGMREMAIAEMVRLGQDVQRFLGKDIPPRLRLEALKSLKGSKGQWSLEAILSDGDPFLFRGAVQQLATVLGRNFHYARTHALKERIGYMLAARREYPMNRSTDSSDRVLDCFARDPSEVVRFLAVKWIADDKLDWYRDDITKAMRDPKVSVRMYMACATALARLDGQQVNERSLADYFAKRLADDATPAAQRAMLLRQVPANHPKLTVDLLSKLLKSDDAALKMEAVRALVDHPNPYASTPLAAVFANEKEPASLRRYAMMPLDAEYYRLEFEEVSRNKQSPLRGDATWAILNAKFRKGDPGRAPEKGRPATKDIDAWLKRLEGKADPDAGARVFFHPKLVGCAKCHRIDGRGADVGPDLSSIGRTDRRHILESILQPSNTVAPHYVAWHLETAAGQVKSGMLIHTNLDEYTYLDAKGDRFKVRTSDLVEQRPLATSIMPDGLVDRLTDQDVRDLLAYLEARK